MRPLRQGRSYAGDVPVLLREGEVSGSASFRGMKNNMPSHISNMSSAAAAAAAAAASAASAPRPEVDASKKTLAKRERPTKPAEPTVVVVKSSAKRPRVSYTAGSGEALAHAPVSASASAEGVDAPELPAPTLRVQNVVSTTTFASVHIRQVVRELADQGPECNSSRFCAAIFRRKNQGKVEDSEHMARLGVLAPKARPGYAAPRPDIPMLHHLYPRAHNNLRTWRIAFLLFPNGRVVLTGARSILQGRQVLESYLEDLRRIGYPDMNMDEEIVVRNMVGCATLGIPINLKRMADRLSLFVSYDPDAFPGASIRNHPLCGPATLLVFESGCIVLTGIRSKSDGDEVLERISPLLRAFRVGLPDDHPIPNVNVDDLAPLGADAPWKMTAMHKEAYQELGLPTTCSIHEVERTHRRLMRNLHPDKHMACPEGSLADRVLKKESNIIGHCAALLTDRNARYEYNRSGRGMLSEEDHRRSVRHFEVLALAIKYKFYAVTEEDIDGDAARQTRERVDAEAAAAAAAAAAGGDAEVDDEKIEDEIDEEISRMIDEMEDMEADEEEDGDDLV